MLSLKNRGLGGGSESFLDLLKKTLRLFKNPVFVFLLVTQTIEGLLQNSFLAFASLFLEHQYRICKSVARIREISVGF
jgi:hypothetical protein